MEPNHAWSVIIVFPLVAAGVIFTFFPYVIIRARARIQMGSDLSAGLQKEERDRVPLNSMLYSARSEMYGEDYYTRLQRMIDHPEEFKRVTILVRLLGLFMLLLATLAIGLYILTFLTGNLSIP